MAKDKTAATPAGERIAKVMARAGLCSRREAERWIEAGRVELNGKKLETPACVVGPDDRIVVDGKPLPGKEPTRLWRYNKPDRLGNVAQRPGRPTHPFSTHCRRICRA